jgi:hypothetical protein
VLLAAEVSQLNAARPDHHQEDRIAHIQVRTRVGGMGAREVGSHSTLAAC